MQPKIKPRLTPRRDKILECLIHLISRAQKSDKTVTQFDLVKSLFFADLAHIEDHGRPITFDNYVAMKHGPVASAAYDMLKDSYRPSDATQAWPLWERKHLKRSAYKFLNPKREANYRKLSKTDVQKLDEAQDLVSTLGFGGASDLSHQHPAYKDAWHEGRTSGSEDMDYRLLMPRGEQERVSDLAFASFHINR